METSGRQFVHPIKDLHIIAKMKEYLLTQSHLKYFFFVFGINTGMNFKEMSTLKVNDIKNKTHLSIAEGRSQKIRIVPLSLSLQKEIINYVKFKDDEELLFISRRGKVITRTYAWMIINEAAKACGFNEQVGNQTMRKTYAYHYFIKTNDLVGLKEFLRKDLRNSLQYIGLTDDAINRHLLKRKAPKTL
ncbi:tyrosine-type recombinase/integrase [Priestia aryabhattai]